MPQTAQPMVISYSRFSSPQQAQGDSRRRQSDAAQAWCLAHGLTLTETFHDGGISAFHGANAAEGHLGRFLSMVQAGTIPAGSVLLLENLDRLSRQAVEVAYQMFMRIVDSGIRIVTLGDGQVYEKGKLDLGRLMISILSMHVANEESEKKSTRIRAAYAAKRQGGKVISGTVPSWCRLVDGKIVLDETKASIIREMAAMSINGHGNAAIAKAVNAKYPTFCAKGFIAPSNVHFMLQSRSLIGEHQPMTLTHVDGKRVRTPIGEPIKGYYPRVLSDDQFHAVAHARAGRRHTGGPSTKWINIFTGILRDVDGSTMTVTRSGGRDGHRSYVSSAAARGSVGASPYVAFPVAPLESALLVQLNDVILPQMSTAGTNDGRVRIDSLTAQVAAVDQKIADIQALVMTTSSISVVAMLGQLDRKRVDLVAELGGAIGEQAARALAPIDAAREQLATLVRYCRDGTRLSDDQRVQVRSALARIIKGITSRFSIISGGRLATITIDMVDGKRYEMSIQAIKGIQEPIVRGQRFITTGGVVIPADILATIRKSYDAEMAEQVA